jgi:glycosyltransferase involved in cell wall biosynthesis
MLTDSTAMTGAIDISVIIPVERDHRELEALHLAYKGALDDYGQTYEMVYVLDGNLPESSKQLKTIQAKDKAIRIVQLAKRFGEAAALTAGFEYSTGGTILTLPAYFQIEATEIGKILQELQGHDMVVARRWPRRGSVYQRLRRRVFHWLLGTTTNVELSDLGCRVRAFKRVVCEEIPIYGDQHRLMPVVVIRRGFQVKELNVAQSTYERASYVYPPRSYLHRLLGLFTVFFLVRFTKKPLRFFGLVGMLLLIIGGSVLLYIIIERLFFGVALADRPALLLSSLVVVLGVQIFALGLIGELIIFTHAKEIKEYRVKQVIN